MANEVKPIESTWSSSVSEYDEAMKFILDFTYSFIKSQQARKTYVYEKDSNGKYVPANSIVHGCKTVYDVDILEKLAEVYDVNVVYFFEEHHPSSLMLHLLNSILY